MHKVIILLLLLGLSSTAEFKISFLTKDEAAKEILNDSMEDYFSLFNELEIEAKSLKKLPGKDLQEKLKNLKKHYSDNVMAFTDAEKAFLKKVCKESTEKLAKDYPKFTALPWSFLKVNRNVENGFPHTRDKHIVLSDMVMSHYLRMHKFRGDLAVKEAAILMIHEQLHVYQRKYKKDFDTMYKELWGYVKADKIDKGDYVKKREIINPDAPHSNWALPIDPKDKNTRYILPILLIKEGRGRKSLMGSMQELGIYLEKVKEGEYKVVYENGKPLKNPLNSIKRYKSIYPLTNYNYHPHESSADLFSKMVVKDLMGHDKFSRFDKAVVKKELDVLRKWFKKIME